MARTPHQTTGRLKAAAPSAIAVPYGSRTRLCSE